YPVLFRNFQRAVPNQNSLITDNSPKSTVNSTIQAPRRKFVDQGKLRANTNASVATVSGNGNSAVGSKLSSLALRSVTLRKGHSWENENIDEGVRGEPFNDSRTNTASMTGSMASSDAKSCDQEDETMSIGGTTLSAQKNPSLCFRIS
ncbi:hypothetical protein EUTSA_v10027380mg, partial [Eutrema salsugineum]